MYKVAILLEISKWRIQKSMPRGFSSQERVCSTMRERDTNRSKQTINEARAHATKERERVREREREREREGGREGEREREREGGREGEIAR